MAPTSMHLTLISCICYVPQVDLKLRYWQDSTTPASPCTRLLNYYNVVLFRKFLTMITTSSIYIEKILTKRLVFPGSGTLNLISFYLLASFKTSF